MVDNRPIGVFDSGVGGLTVAKEIKRVLPMERIVYFGDTKHLPYGDKSPETIQDYSQRIVRFLLELDCKAIVVACNSAASNALEVIRAEAGDYPVFDVIAPVAEKIAFDFHQKIGVIATKATVNSGIYKKSIRKCNRHIKVQELATPLLVPIIEEGLLRSEISRSGIAHYLSHKKLQNIDAIILGCTHYPLLEREINDYYNKRIKVVNSPLIVANRVREHLKAMGKLAEREGEGDYVFYLSDYTANFGKLAKRFFGNQIEIRQKYLPECISEKALEGKELAQEGK